MESRQDIKQAVKINRTAFFEAIRRGFGVGDIVSSVTNAVGIKPCGGCTNRKKSLNRLNVKL